MNKLFCLILLAMTPYIFASETSTTRLNTENDSTKSDNIKNGNIKNENFKTESKEDIESIYVFGSKDKTFLTPGSAQFLQKEEVKDLDYTDATRVLQTVPGVYIQEEDSLGLRVNIGLRGATPHRSKKITLMEDGVIIGPAPYSAPAAYFSPNILRTENIEVFKGFSSAIYGPNSIGGAVNFITTPVSKTPLQKAEVTIGEVQKYKVTSSGPITNNLGYLIEASRLNSKGIKKLPLRQDTGFHKNDVLVKFEYKPTKKNKLSLKASYSDEDSHETYLGLSEADFAKDAYQRYAASANDKLDWDHQQIQLRYDYKLNDYIKFNTTAYFHKFNRNWSKLSNFKEGQDFNISLSEFIDPNSDNFEQVYFDILTGKENSTAASGVDSLIIGNNDRTYYSTGVQTALDITNPIGSGVLHTLTGLRLHRDRIIRDHTEDTFRMVNGRLVANPNFSRVDGAQNKDRAKALTYFLKQEFDFGTGLLINWGGRYEYIDTQRQDFKTGQNISDQQSIFAPGIGLQYSPNSNLNFVAGVNEGVSVIGPGQDPSVDPERSTNYEAGIKFNYSKLKGEVIGFYSDYKNIKGFCSFSSGCDENNLDKEFNGGKAKIQGVETSLATDLNFKSFNFPLSVTHTYTQAEFAEALESENSEWGIGAIKSGDPLPYIPKNKTTFAAGIKYKKAAAAIKYNLQSKVFDQSVSTNRKTIKGYGFVDIITKYKYSKKSELLLSVDNLLDKDYSVSLRPSGLRPGKPRSINVGIKHVF